MVRSIRSPRQLGKRWICLTIRPDLSVAAIREDRILDEAHATGGDVRRLADLFGLSSQAGTRYTGLLGHPDRAQQRAHLTDNAGNPSPQPIRAARMPSVSVDFISGVELSRRLHIDAVQPLLSRYLPDLTYSAALIGAGSEVLGFDTQRSTDHDWGPRLHLFLAADDLARHGGRIDNLLSERLPTTIAGYPTSLVPTEHGTRHLRHTTGRVHHGVVIAEPGTWLTDHLGFNPLTDITPRGWLAAPTQALAEVTAGAVCHDGLGVLHAMRRALAWYPDDMWRYVLACQWQRLSQEEPFVGRCGEVGDELGSAVVAARLVRDLMRLRLLISRTYPPYSKWLGSAFARLPDTEQLGVTLTAALAATSWHDREDHLVTAYETVAALHNDLGLTPPVDPGVRPFHDRPFRVLHAERFTQALIGSITDHALRALPLTGAIDQFVDSTDALGHRVHSCALAAALYPNIP